MGYYLTRQTIGGQRQTGVGWLGLNFDGRKTVALGKGCSQLKAGQKGSPGSHCPTAFRGGIVLYWDGKVMVPWSEFGCVGLHVLLWDVCTRYTGWIRVDGHGCLSL